MKKRSDIFNGLKKYGLTPPTDVRGDLFHLLKAEMKRDSEGRRRESLAFLQDIGVPPPGSLHDSIEKDIYRLPRLLFLQEAGMAPPQEVTDSIGQKLRPRQVAGQGKSVPLFIPDKKLIHLKIRGLSRRILAACLVMVLVLWGIFRLAPALQPKSPGVTTVLKMTPRQPASSLRATPPAGILSDPGKPGDPMPDRDKLADKTAGGKTAKDSRNKPKPENYFRSHRVGAEGKEFTLVDDDLLVTLTGFHYDAIPGFITREDKDITIKVDEYASISISPEMHKMMKRMYCYRSPGLPTRKARKERERLEGWKKADEAFFDGQTGKNPLDPADLAEFLFK